MRGMSVEERRGEGRVECKRLSAIATGSGTLASCQRGERNEAVGVSIEKGIGKLVVGLGFGFGTEETARHERIASAASRGRICGAGRQMHKATFVIHDLKAGVPRERTRLVSTFGSHTPRRGNTRQAPASV